jgi:beta-lactamase class A
VQRPGWSLTAPLVADLEHETRIIDMSDRRHFLTQSAALSALSLAPALAWSADRGHRATTRLRALELGAARLGVCMLDTVTGESTGHRVDEHFAMCSTFKLPLVAACLREADHGRLDLAEVLPYTRADLLPWAPVTGRHLDQGGLSIAVLAQAAQEMSDGPAANLLVKRLGGPAAVTRKLREMGDAVFRLDRYEPDLGLVLSGDLRDTTSPRAMAELVRRVCTGGLLQPGSRHRMLQWMENTQTGPRRLRAGLPADWRTGNKTGTGRAEGTTNKCNDIAITFPNRGNPIVVAAYFDSGEFTAQVEARHEAVLAEVGKIAAAWALAAPQIKP